MTYNQLINHELIDFLTETKKVLLKLWMIAGKKENNIRKNMFSFFYFLISLFLPALFFNT